MKYKAIVQIELSIEADNRNIAKKLIRQDKPFVDVAGISTVEGYYKIKTTNKQKIISLKQKKNKK
jgi:hypothetical protein